MHEFDDTLVVADSLGNNEVELVSMLGKAIG